MAGSARGDQPESARAASSASIASESAPPHTAAIPKYNDGCRGQRPAIGRLEIIGQRLVDLDPAARPGHRLRHPALTPGHVGADHGELAPDERPPLAGHDRGVEQRRRAARRHVVTEEHRRPRRRERGFDEGRVALQQHRAPEPDRGRLAARRPGVVVLEEDLSHQCGVAVEEGDAHRLLEQLVLPAPSCRHAPGRGGRPVIVGTQLVAGEVAR